MSDSKAAAINQARAFQARAAQKQAEHAAKEKELNRLRSARTQLNAKIDAYGTYHTRITSMKDHISSVDFKGNRRDKFNTKFDKVGTEANNYQNGQQSNLKDLNLEIAKREAQQWDLLGAIGSLYQSAENLIRSHF